MHRADLSKIRGVIFDFDGTLANSLEIYWAAFNEGVTQLGLKPVKRRDIVGDLSAGTPLDGIVARLFPTELKRREGLVDECRERMNASFEALWSGHLRLFRNVPTVIRSLSDRGLKIAIATGRYKAVDDVRRVLESCDLSSCISVVISGEEVAARKPAPDIIVEAARRLQLHPSDCIVVGDSIADIKASKAAGARTVAVTTGAGDRRTLVKEKPDHLLRSVRELPALFDVKYSRNKSSKPTMERSKRDQRK